MAHPPVPLGVQRGGQEKFVLGRPSCGEAPHGGQARVGVYGRLQQGGGGGAVGGGGGHGEALQVEGGPAAHFGGLRGVQKAAEGQRISGGGAFAPAGEVVEPLQLTDVQQRIGGLVGRHAGEVPQAGGGGHFSGGGDDGGVHVLPQASRIEGLKEGLDVPFPGLAEGVSGGGGHQFLPVGQRAFQGGAGGRRQGRETGQGAGGQVAVARVGVRQVSGQGVGIPFVPEVVEAAADGVVQVDDDAGVAGFLAGGDAGGEGGQQEEEAPGTEGGEGRRGRGCREDSGGSRGRHGRSGVVDLEG